MIRTKDMLCVMSNNLLQLEEPGGIHVRPVGSTNMIVVFTLSIIEEAIPSTYREAEISSESKMRKDVMMKGISSLLKNDT